MNLERQDNVSLYLCVYIYLYLSVYECVFARARRNSTTNDKIFLFPPWCIFPSSSFVCLFVGRFHRWWRVRMYLYRLVDIDRSWMKIYWIALITRAFPWMLSPQPRLAHTKSYRFLKSNSVDVTSGLQIYRTVPGREKNEWMTLLITTSSVRTPAASSFFWYSKDPLSRMVSMDAPTDRSCRHAMDPIQQQWRGRGEDGRNRRIVEPMLVDFFDLRRSVRHYHRT